MDDRRILDRPDEADIDASVEKIAAEFRAGFEQVALIDRPAVALFGSARVDGGKRPVRGGAGRRPAVRRSRLGGRHRRRPRRDGGRRTAARAKAAGSRSASTSSCRTSRARNPYCDIAHTFDHFYARKVCFVRPVAGLRHLPRRLRHARRAVRVADADPDRTRSATSPSCSSTPTTGARWSTGSGRAGRRRDDLGGGHRPPAPDRRSGRGACGTCSTATSAAAPPRDARRCSAARSTDRAAFGPGP